MVSTQAWRTWKKNHLDTNNSNVFLYIAKSEVSFADNDVFSDAKNCYWTAFFHLEILGNA